MSGGSAGTDGFGACLDALLAAEADAAVAYADRLVLLERLERLGGEVAVDVLDLLRSDDRTDEPIVRLHAAAAELAAAARLSPTGARVELEIAIRLVRRFPAVVARLRETVGGAPALTAAKVRALHAATDDLDDHDTRRVLDRVLVRGAADTPGQFVARVRRAVVAVAAETYEQRRSRAVAARRVRVRPLDDGTCTLVATGLPVALGRAVDLALTGLAGRGVDPGDPRTVEQRRTDCLLGCVLGPGRLLDRPQGLLTSEDDRDPYADPPPVGVPVPAGTDVAAARAALLQARELLAGVGWDVPVPPRVTVALVHDLRQDPGGGEDTGPVTDLDGVGPVDPGTVGHLVDAPGEGPDRIVDLGTPPPPDPGYRPSAATRRWVVARDRSCRWPGCTRRAAGCDLDHVVPYARSGTTSATGLVCLCRHHHRLKHQTAWQLELLHDGTAVWTSPTRRRYTTRPGLDPP